MVFSTMVFSFSLSVHQYCLLPFVLMCSALLFNQCHRRNICTCTCNLHGYSAASLCISYIYSSAVLHVLSLWYILLTRSGSSEMHHLAALEAELPVFSPVTAAYMEDQGSLSGNCYCSALQTWSEGITCRLVKSPCWLIPGAFEASN